MRKLLSILITPFVVLFAVLFAITVFTLAILDYILNKLLSVQGKRLETTIDFNIKTKKEVR